MSTTKTVCDNCHAVSAEWDATVRIWDKSDTWGWGFHLCQVCYNRVRKVLAHAIKENEQHRAKAKAYLSRERDNQL